MLIVSGITGALDGSDFPWPVGRVMLVAAGVALLALAVAIWRDRLPLNLLAYGNGLAAVAGLIWLVGVSGWSTAGAILIALTVGGLALLAAAQAATLRA